MSIAPIVPGGPGRLWRRVGSNSLANVFAGGSALVYQLGLTFLAARAFDATGFAAWTLALSMAGLAPLFAFNLSAVVTRQLVRCLPADVALAGVVMGAARRIALVLAGAALVLIVLAAFPLHRYSSDLRAITLPAFALAVLLLTLGQLWQVTLHPALGWHYARERNWPAVSTFVLTRGSALIAMAVATAFAGGSLLAVAACLATGHWVGIAVAYWSGLGPADGGPATGEQRRTQLRETVLLLRWFAVWSLCMAANQFGMPQIISLLGSADYNAFYLAFSLNIVLSGVIAAIGSALLAPVARLVASGEHERLARLLTVVPGGLALLLLAGLELLRVSMPALVTHWSQGIATATAVNGYLILLGFQTLSRSLSGVFGMVLASHATALQLIGPPLLEAGLVLLVGLPLGVVLGERAFLLSLAGAGLAATLVTVLVSIRVGGLTTGERRRVVGRFAIVQIAALVSWWILVNW